jgi:heme oxygenase
MHDRVDSLFSRADLSTREGYAEFLTAQARAHLSVENALDAAGAADFVSDWNSRRRSALLLGDLEQLGLTPPALLHHEIARGEAAVIGGIYVLEGSRLGGALLRRSVAPGLPAAFLSASDPAAWRRLIEIIDDRLRNEDEIAAATRAARDVFATFEASAQHSLEVN